MKTYTLTSYTSPGGTFLWVTEKFPGGKRVVETRFSCDMTAEEMAALLHELADYLVVREPSPYT